MLAMGDRVLVEILAFDGRHKLSDKCEDKAYIVVGQPSKDIPVYIVQREDNTSVKIKLHRNHLLPINHLPVSKIESKPVNKIESKPTTKRKVSVTSTGSTESSDDTSDEEDYVVVSPVNNPPDVEETHDNYSSTASGATEEMVSETRSSLHDSDSNLDEDISDSNQSIMSESSNSSREPPGE